jgi:hypothetical protein
MKITQKAREWFQGITEMDLDLMISMGVITANRVMKMYYGRVKTREIKK